MYSGARLATISSEAIRSAAIQHFGFNPRDEQEKVIQAVCNGQDAVVLWATGQGKSLCYQLPALIQSKTVFVVSPLISLMSDQVNNINNKVAINKGPACFLGSAQTDYTVEQDALNGHYLIVYLTPEKLCSEGFLNRLTPLVTANRLALLAIDEAHCTSEWGNDFRPEYSRLHTFREHFPHIPLVALTATAVDRVVTDIASSLTLRSPLISRTSLDRTNLKLSVAMKRGFEADMKRVVECLDGAVDASGRIGACIIYVASRNDAEKVASSLAYKYQGILNVSFYHGSMSTPDREAVHRGFLVGSIRIVVATIAFGMGIDKPDIRTIIHFGAPSTMEAYVQHIGRAGRDGLPSHCLALYSDTDFADYQSDFYTKNKPPAVLEASHKSMGFLQVHLMSPTPDPRLPYNPPIELLC